MVIFAQKIKGKSLPSSHPVRIRNLQKQPVLIDRYKESGLFTRSALASSQAAWTVGYRASDKAKTTHVLNYSTILTASEWKIIQSASVPLADVSRVVPGCIKGSPKRCRINIIKPKEMTWLAGPLKVIPSEFVISYAQASHVVYPNEIEEPRFEDLDLFEAPKILLVSDPNPSWGKRVKVAIERQGALASGGFFAIGPRSEPPVVALEVIAAVVRWKVCNAWVLEWLRYPWINKWVVDSMPFPKALLSSPGECRRLEKALSRLEQAAQIGKKDGTAEAEMDEILMRAYGLRNGSFWERLVAVYNWDSIGISRISLDDSTFRDGADWIVQGTVVEVRASQGEVTLWLNSFDEIQTVPIMPVMPGWLLRPEVKFVTRVPASEVQAGVLTGKYWGRFEPEHYTYLSQIEIAQIINAKMLRNKGSKR